MVRRSSPSGAAGAGPSARKPGEERYRRGARRTAAEPLAASWDPDGSGEEPVEESSPRQDRRGGLPGLLAAYGWRIYAIPVLLVLTALVVLNPGKQGDGGTAPAQGGGAPGASSGAPVGSEKPAAPVDLKVPTADLPDGGKFTQTGAGTWKTVPGTTDKAGKGKLYTYTIEIEDGIDAGDYGGDAAAFAKGVDSTLADPRSWTGTGDVAMQRVDPAQTPNPSFRISLTTPDTDHSLCGYQIKFEASCYDPGTKRVIINVARWVRGAKAFPSTDLSIYRTYAINHEVGHALNHQHVGCPANGAPAPVMMQQTFGVSNDYVAKLNEVDASNKFAVEADGKVCTPNAYPNPDGKPAG
ncbi:DUF3152 domain-containing protein [Solihabitans fulvus]|uniref:DUF3152 domain-containing protein n=1 Tax=Solihabitans fulvus TaxID=1892852 RepID=A0A5B2XK47_9PSEU|nr:DUF3152 domain-containing protein [Solihabitans fulvus]